VTFELMIDGGGLSHSQGHVVGPDSLSVPDRSWLTIPAAPAACAGVKGGSRDEDDAVNVDRLLVCALVPSDFLGGSNSRLP
jgi:hypothetical protein